MESEPSQASGKLLGIARRAKSRDPMETVVEVLVTKEFGVDADYHGREPGRQVSVISAEAWKEACTELGVEVPWTARRANLMLGEIELCDSAGARISIGDLVLEIVEETRHAESRTFSGKASGADSSRAGARGLPAMS